ncbi:unnamed protein product [Closterium sp. NIES-64]|nr:unnamed protein product [Closterium sp. NIES-64]CAI6002144.1 unnamed protein product [Closterium sp. NIES-65]
MAASHGLTALLHRRLADTASLASGSSSFFVPSLDPSLTPSLSHRHQRSSVDFPSDQQLDRFVPAGTRAAAECGRSRGARAGTCHAVASGGSDGGSGGGANYARSWRNKGESARARVTIARVGISMSGLSLGGSYSGGSGSISGSGEAQQGWQQQRRPQQQQRPGGRRGVLPQRRPSAELLSEERRKKEVERAMREARGKGGAEGLAEALQIEPPAQPQWPFWRKKRESSSGEARMLTRRIVELGKRRQLDQVFQLLDDAKRSRKAVNMITMNAAMAACVNCGDIDRALDLFDDMTADGGTGVDSITYGTLLKGLGRAKRLDDAFEVLEAMEDGTAPGRPELTAVHLNTLVNACADAGDARRAMSVVQRYKRAFSGAIGPSAFTYNLLLKGYARSDNPLEALSVAEEMHLQGLQWERVTFNCLILACVRAGDMDRALDLLQDMKAEALRRGDDDVLPDAVTYTTIIKGLSEEGDIDALRDVVADMKRANCVRSPAGPSQPHCRALLAAEGPSGVAAIGGEEGVSSAVIPVTSSSAGSAVIDGSSTGSSTGSSGVASSNPLVMDRVAYTAIIDAFVAVGSPEDALQCMAELEELGRADRGMRPRAHVFLSLMRSLAAAGDLPSTQQLAGRLVRDAGGRVWPEERAEAAELVLEAATRAGEMGVAARLLDQMEAMHGHQLRMSLRGMQAVVQLMAATGAGFERFTPIGIRQELSLRDTVQSVMVPLADVAVAHPDQSLAELRSAWPDLMPADVIPVINGADECVGVLRVPSHAVDPTTLITHLMLPPPPSLSCLSTVSEAALLLSSCRTPLAAVVAGSARMRYGLAKEAVQRGAGEERRVVGFVRAEAVFEGHGGCWWHSGEQREEGDVVEEVAALEGGDVPLGEADGGEFGGSSSDSDSLCSCVKAA